MWLPLQVWQSEEVYLLGSSLLAEQMGISSCGFWALKACSHLCRVQEPHISMSSVSVDAQSLDL